MKKIHQNESGSAILMVIVLISVLAVIICQNGVVLSLLQKELKLIENKHEERVKKIQQQEKND